MISCKLMTILIWPIITQNRSPTRKQISILLDFNPTVRYTFSSINYIITKLLETRDLIEGQTAFSLLEKEVDSTPIITFNQAIDDMLGGGVACGKLTEFCGVPGIGKTQMGYVTKT